jgi:hypothetical protein
MRYVRRFHRVLETIEHFSGVTLEYKNHNLLSLDTILNEEEKSIFNIDLKGIDWYKYCESFYFGARKYLLKEKEINVEKDRFRMKL